MTAFNPDEYLAAPTPKAAAFNPDAYLAAPIGKSAAYKEGRSSNGSLQGLITSVNGPLLGFADEALGALGAPLKSLVTGRSVGDEYRELRDSYRGMQDQYSADHPYMAPASQIAASAPLGMMKLFGAAAPVAGTVAQPMNMLQKMLQAGKMGAGYGAASGAGNSIADSASGVAADTAKGAVTGAALSGAAVPVASVLGAVGGNIAQRVNSGSAANYAKEKVAEALVRDGRGSVVQNALSNPVTQAASRLNKLGEPAVIADAGGQSTRGLLDVLATLPGKTKDAAAQLLRDRKTGSAGRMISAADDALGTGGKRLAATVDDLVAAREQAAAPLYQQLQSTSVAAPSAGLQSAVAAAEQLGATKFGQQMATARQQPYSLDVANPANWSMRDLDHVKQGMDQLIAKQWDAVAGKLTPLGASYQQLKNKLVGELDTATINPQTGASLYKSARDAFAGPSALIDAGRAGNAAITQNEARISQTVANMSASELDAFRVGAYEALREKIGRSAGGRTEMMNMAENPAISAKLKVIFGGDRPFREFASNVEKERILKQLQATGAGSQTASRQYAAGDMDVGALQDAGGAVASAAGGNMAGLLSGAVNTWNRVKTPETVRDQMGKILMSGGAQGQNQLAEMMNMAQKINARNAQNSNQLGVLMSKPAGSWFLD